MKIADEIREVLKKLIDTITDGQELAGGECMEIDQALKEILKLIEKTTKISWDSYWEKTKSGRNE